ncbi:MAG: TIGR04255 family protein, partial [Rhodospirillaceae bacterium]
VVARVDFVSKVVGIENEMPQKMVKTILERFPIEEPIEHVGRKIEIGVGAPTKDVETRTKEWVFFGRDRSKRLSITQQAAYISYAKYMKYEDVKSDFSAITKLFVDNYPDAYTARLGMRYINSIEIYDMKDPTRWDYYIAKPLLIDTKLFNNKHGITRLFSVAELKYDDIDIRLQFGMPNTDYPAPIRRPQFVIDIDGYMQTPHMLAESPQHIDRVHTYIQLLFEKSITQKLRDRMNA